jgi:O-antigen/teichoic acid export membrane protein
MSKEMEVDHAAIIDIAHGKISILKKRIKNFRAKISKRHGTIRSVAVLLSSSITSTVLNAFGGLLVGHFLGPHETGLFRTFNIPMMYLGFLHLGTIDGLLLKIPYYVGKEAPEQVDKLASAAGSFNRLLSIFLSFGFVCCAAYSLAHHNLYGLFGWLSQAVFCWEYFYGDSLAATYRTLYNFVALGRIQVMRALFTFGMVILLPILGFYGLCARLALPSALLVWLYQRNRPLKVTHRFDSKALSELIRVGLPLSFWGTLYTSAWVATESALILSLSGVTALGLFSMAYAIRSAVNIVPETIWQVLTPRVVTTLARDGSVSKANARIIWVTAGLTGFMVVLTFGGALLLDIFIPYVLPKYIAGITAMKVCLCFPVVQSAFLPNNILFATGRPWIFNRSVIPGIVIFLLATFLLYSYTHIGGLLAVIVGSLLGRTARVVAAYVDLVLLTREYPYREYT